MQTYPEMNRIIVGMIEDSEHLHVQYAAARIKELEQELDMIEYTSLAQRIAIEELEQQLHDAREAAQAQSETAQHDWLSPAEAEGLRQELREAKADLATMDADRQDDRLNNPHFGTSPRYLVEVQRDRLKDQLKETRKALADARQTILLDCMDREGCD